MRKMNAETKQEKEVEEAEWIDNSVQAGFTRLYKEGNFGEVVLVGWAYVEYMIDLFMVQEFGIKHDDNERRKAVMEFLEEIDFEDKWSFLKKLDLFTDDEKKSISTFQNQRNKLFHNRLFNNPNYYGPIGRKKLMGLAKDAFFATYHAFGRKYIKDLDIKEYM